MQLNKSVLLNPYFSDLTQTLMGLLWVCKRIQDVVRNVVSSCQCKSLGKERLQSERLNHEVILVQAKLLFSLSTSIEI